MVKTDVTVAKCQQRGNGRCEYGRHEQHQLG